MIQLIYNFMKTDQNFLQFIKLIFIFSDYKEKKF